MTAAAQCLQAQWQQILGVAVAAAVVALTMVTISWAVRKALAPRLKRVSIEGLWVSAAFLFLVLYLASLALTTALGAGPFEKVLFEMLGINKALPTVARCLPSGSESLWSLSAPFYFPVLYAAIHLLFLIFAFLLLVGLVGLKTAFAPLPAEKDRARPKAGDGKEKAENGDVVQAKGGGPALEDAGSPGPVQSAAWEGESKDEPAMPKGFLAPLLGPLFQFFGYWMDIKYIEIRYREAVAGILFALWLAKWLSLPAAFLGTLSPTAWIVFALLINALKDNLSADSRAPESVRKKAPAHEVDEEPQKSVSIAALMKAIDEAQEGFELHSVGADEAMPSRTVDSELLSAGPAMRIVAEKLGLQSGLYAHQEACFTHLSEGSHVLLATAPLSGRTTVGDLLVLHQVLTVGQTVIYLCPNEESAADRRAVLDSVVRKVDWDWNLFIFDLCNDAPEGLDLNMRQPQVLLLTAELLHRKLLPRARDWELFLRNLGMVVVLGLESYTGAPGANFHRLMRRFQKVCADYGAEPRFFATAVPYNADLRAYAEALLGVSLVYVGPGMDTAPEPAREIVTCLPSQRTPSGGEIPIPVLVAGTAAALGHKASLFGFEQTLTREEEARLAEVLLEHGKSGTLGRAGRARGGLGSAVPGRLAEVVVTEADPAGVRLVTELTRHFGADLVDHAVRLEHLADQATHAADSGAAKGFSGLDASFGLDESAFGSKKGDDDASEKPEEPEEKEALDPTSGRHDSDDAPEGTGGAAQGGSDEEDEDKPYWSQTTSATVVLPADQPFVKLLMAKGLVGSDKSHPFLGRGCDLVTNPDNVLAKEKNLLCALAESSWSEEQLRFEFGAELVDRALVDLQQQGLLAREDRLEIHRRTGAVRRVSHLHSVGHPLPHDTLSMDTVTSDHVTVRDRHTKESLLRIDRVRALTEVYPGLVFLADRRRYRICDPDDQTGFDEGFIDADPYERPLVTSKIRRLSVEPLQEDRRRKERRRGDRRKAADLAGGRQAGKQTDDAPQGAALSAQDARGGDDRRKEDRRAALAHSFGGSAFFLWYPWVYLHEWVIGVKTYDALGSMLDVTYFSRPIETRYKTRAAVLAFPTQNPSKAVLHSLVHLFGHVLPSFVRHSAFDLDIAFAEQFGKDELPAIFFLDRHPGDAGFARSVTTEVLKNLCYWSYKLAADCPNHCESPTGCLGCLRSLQCHQPHGGPETDLDREGVLSLIEDLLGGFPK